MKNQFNEAMAREWLQMLQTAQMDPSYPESLNIQASAFHPLEMRQRIALLGEALYDAFDRNYDHLAAAAFQVFKLWPEPTEISWKEGAKLEPLSYVVEKYGLDHFETSMRLMEAITIRFTSEFAIRPYLMVHPEAALNQMIQWSKSPNEHLRRLASEGSRTRLPWGKKLHQFIAEPKRTLPILEQLRNDPSLYVRRSVANHLNDILKDNSEYAMGIVEKWSREKDPGTQWIVKYALRVKVKEGNTQALKILGFESTDSVTGMLRCQPTKLLFPGELTLEFQLKNESNRAQKLAIDLKVDFVKASGKTAPKVFKGLVWHAQPFEEKNFTRKISIKPITTRTYYPGVHTVAIQVNGKTVMSDSFHLIK